MNNQITLTLKRQLEKISTSSEAIGFDIQRNAAKEVLQYYVLNFVYHHPEYSHWIMYGGSALRICHDLDRMSVDLDFEIDHEITNNFLTRLRKELLTYFSNTYTVDSNFLTISTTNHRGVTLKFHIAEELNLPFHSKQVHVKIDLNHFDVHPNIVTERHPQNEYQLSFVIKSYNMSALMASKIAAIFLRGRRGVGKEIYQEKGRDIYDLLWYMDKKIIPDLDYLKAKQVKEAENLGTLFDTLTKKILNSPNIDQNLKDDLTPLFTNQIYIQNWLTNWRELYLRLLKTYEIHTITAFEKIRVSQDFHIDTFSFIFYYVTEEKNSVRIIYRISDDWIDDKSDLPVKVSDTIKDSFEFNNNGIMSSRPPNQDTLMQYAQLFYNKTEKYLKTTHRIILGDTMVTKLIRTTADNFNQTEQILLNKSALVSCELEELLH